MKDNPYVGPRSYTRDDKRKFFGRERDARDLAITIWAEQVTLLYAQSGAGKTSLLNAQVIPMLEKRGLYVLPVARVGGDLPPGIDDQSVKNIFVFSALTGLAPGDTSPQQLLDHTVLDCLREFYPECSDNQGNRPPLLILDQFEELFTTHERRWQNAEGLIQQICEALDALPRLGVVLAMREDYVAEMDRYTHLLPIPLRARFRLEPLGYEQALDAVVKPACQAGIRFNPGVAEQLVNNLRRIKTPAMGKTGQAEPTLGQYVEPVQLQLVCCELWEKLPETEDGNRPIQWSFIRSHANPDRTLADFYKSVVEQTVNDTGVKERELRRWFAETLITPRQTRASVLREETDTAGLANEAVKILEERYLIRADVRAGNRWYELVHDRFIDPIRESNQAWEAQRETPLRLAARKWKNDPQASSLLYRGGELKKALAWADANPGEVEPYEAEFLRESKKRRQRGQVLLAVGLAVVAVAVVIAIVMANLRNDAQREAQIAFSRELTAAAVNNLTIDPERSILLALQAISTTQNITTEILPEVIDVLEQAVQTSRVRNTFQGNIVPQGDLAISPDGKGLVTLDNQHTVKIWSLDPGQEVTPASRPTGWLLCSSFDSARIQLASETNEEIDFFDKNLVNQGNPLQFGSTVYGVFSSDCTHMALIHESGAVNIWDIMTRKPSDNAFTIDHVGTIRFLALDQSGIHLAVGYEDGTLEICTVQSAKCQPFPAVTDRITAAAFSPDGKRLATGDDNYDLKLWDITEAGVISPLLTLRGHTNTIFSIAFDPTGNYVVTASGDNTAKVWSVQPEATSRRQLFTLAGHSDSVVKAVFSPDGTYIATASDDGTVRVWDATIGHTDRVSSVAFSPNGKYLVTAGDDQKVIGWDSATGKQRFVISDTMGRAWSVGFDPAGQWLAIGYKGGGIQIRSALSNTLLRSITTTSYVSSVAFNRDRKLLVANAENGSFLWDADSDNVLHTLPDQLSVTQAAFSFDGTRIATASQDRTAKIWSVDSGEELMTLPHDDALFSVAFDPVADRLATGSTTGKITLWDVSSLSPTIRRRITTTNIINNITFSPNGKYLASASYDTTAKVWDSLSGDLLLTIHHPAEVYGVAFSPDGKTLASVGEDGILRLYPLDTQDLINLAQERVTRQLTCQERIQYLHENNVCATPTP